VVSTVAIFDKNLHGTYLYAALKNVDIRHAGVSDLQREGEMSQA